MAAVESHARFWHSLEASTDSFESIIRSQMTSKSSIVNCQRWIDMAAKLLPVRSIVFHDIIIMLIIINFFCTFSSKGIIDTFLNHFLIEEQYRLNSFRIFSCDSVTENLMYSFHIFKICGSWAFLDEFWKNFWDLLVVGQFVDAVLPQIFKENLSSVQI